jgi:hypothetical protein
MTSRLRTLSWVLVLAAGCGSSGDGDSQLGTGVNGGQTGEEGSGCKAERTTRLAWSERSALGFSADELLGALGDEQDTRLTYEDGTSTTLSLALARGDEGAVEYQERAFVSDGSGAEIAPEQCPDVVSVPVALTFSTGDQAFAEDWSLTLLAESTTSASARVEIDLEALRGNFTVTQVDPAEFDEVLAYLALTLSNDGWSGRVDGVGVQSDGSGPDDTVSATPFDIASF